MPTTVRETEPNGYTQYPDRDLEPKTYPEYPTELTAETARVFAEAYEAAYRHNTALTDNPTYDQLLAEAGVPDWAVVDHRQGYLVGVNVEVRGSDYPQPTGVSPTKGSSFYYPASAWYYLTPSVALRNEFEPGRLLSSCEEVDAVTVYRGYPAGSVLTCTRLRCSTT